MDFQAYLALGCVALTVAAFAYRLARPRKKSGCGKGCGCGAAGKKQGDYIRANSWRNLE